MRRIGLGLVVTLALALVACGGDDGGDEGAGGSGDTTPATDYTETRPASIQPGDEVPAPSGPVVLKLSGAITNTNVDDTLQFDLETLEQLGVVEYEADDQQAEGGVVTFGGVLVDRLLDVAGADEGATTLETVALNDYTVEIPMSDVRAYPVMLATSVGGERMSVDRFGPTRIVYPNRAYEFDSLIYDARWIWQLAEIRVR